MKKILMVGAGSCQINAIKRMKAMGHMVFAADYNQTTEGKRLSDVAIVADAFDTEAILEAAKSNGVDGILTVGTDQPVLTVAKVAEALQLNRFIDSDTAVLVTNKKYMKQRFKRFNLPTVPFALINRYFQSSDLSGLMPPFVIKPIDSQGQRGIFIVHSIDEIRLKFDEVIKYSRESEILVEQFYESTEVTVSGWVNRGKSTIFTLTDRVTFPAEKQLGVCIAHRYPSIHAKRQAQIEGLTQEICTYFGINEGPIYFQLLVGDQGVLINEIACRLGGAYEDMTIPFATGVSPLDLVIKGSLTPPEKMERVVFAPKEKCAFNTQLFFIKPGKITGMTPLAKIKALSYVIDAGYNFRIGDTVKPLENASQRAGFIIITGSNSEEVELRIKEVYQLLKIFDENGNNLVIDYDCALTGQF